MTENEQKLGQKIADFELDKSNIGLTFSQRLAKENNFSETFAKQIVVEYKRFIFLCCVANRPVSPSYYVDLAWHLHLTYTKSYWIEFCENTLQKDIHHNPTEGGRAENQKFKGYFNDTLALYEQWFQQKPPASIWTNAKDKKEWITINTNEHWVIPKIKLPPFKPQSSLLLKVLLLSSLLIGCSSGSVVVFISGFIFLFIIFAGIFMKNESTKKPNHTSDGNCSSGGGSYSSDSHSSHGHDGHDGDSGDGNDGGGSDGGGDSGGDSGCSGCGGGD